MSEENAPIGEFNSDSIEKEPEKPVGKEAEWWEFTCRTCNGKFAANVYEPRFCLFCGAEMHFK